MEAKDTKADGTKKEKLETSLKLMGICASDMKCEKITTDIVSRIKDICYCKISDKNMHKMCYLDDAVTDSDSESDSSENTASIENLLQSHHNIRTRWKTCEECKDLILNRITDEISNYIKKDSTYMLSRFMGLEKLVISWITQIITSKFSTMKDEIMRTLDTYVNILLLNGTCCNTDTETMRKKTIILLLGSVFYPQICSIVDDEKFMFGLDNFTFCENKEYTKTRHQLMADIEKLKIHIDKISKI